MKRVVITGMGPVTPIGIGEVAFAQGQREGKNGIGPITRFDITNYPAKIAGEITADLSGHLDAREAKRMDRFVQLALIGAELAVADSGLSPEQLAGEGTGTIVGTGVGGMETWEEQSAIAHSRGAHRVSPMFIPMIICNMASGHIAMRYGLTGPSSTVVTACASGSGAIGDAMRVIQLGLADIMLTGGTEAAITPFSIGSFGNMKALSTRNDSPATASRPFSASRDGFVLGEGAGILVIEELEHALARGARIHAELVGYATSADAYHITMPAPEGRGAQVAMRAALKSAGVRPDEVGYINAHGTSTPLGDVAETKAVKRLFGDHAKRLMISSTKSMIGHLLGASGGVEAIACALTLKHGVVHPTINLLHQDVDAGCDLDYVPNTAREARVTKVLSNSFGFGGQNCSLALGAV